MFYAILSMLFAGLTGVIAKPGLAGITGELGLTVRTGFVCLMVLLFAVVRVPLSDFATLTRLNYLWLGLSAITTTASWIFYYKALEQGDVSTISIIDKGSFVVAVALAWCVLGERMTPRLALGCVLVLAGLLVAMKK